MIDFLKCICYLSALGLMMFLLGRILPKSWFCGERFPFRPFRFEKEGRIYRAVSVEKWKEAVPDMSVILPSLMPSKRLPKKLTTQHIKRMIQETCVTEWTHVLLCLLGFGCVFLWRKAGGCLLSTLYMLGNLPYIIIQRYNCPKLIGILRRLENRERQESCC